MPVQLGDHTDGGEATEQYLEQHAAGARVKVGVDWGFKEKPSGQHEKRQRQAFLHSVGPIRGQIGRRITESVTPVTAQSW